MSCRVLIFAHVLSVLWTPLLLARDIHVDPKSGDDSSVNGPVKTIRQAIRLARPGDTIHLLPIVYRESANFYGKRGEEGNPITLDGHGATLEGSDPLDPKQWREVESGLFRCDDLLPYLDDAIIGRWFLLWNGRMSHMGRTLKGPSAALKQSGDLKPGEWTFVKDAKRKMPKRLQIAGAFYVKLLPGQELADANIFVPSRAAGVQFDARGENKNSHLVIRNLTSTHVYNDGFNIHGNCEDVLFENIRAIECGDDGISAHESAQYRVNGFVSIGNSTGICDTGASETSYNRVFIRDCLGFDLYFLNTGRHSITNAVVLSSAVHALRVVGDEQVDQPCRLKMDNVYIRRITNESNVRLYDNSALDARRVTFLGLNILGIGGEARLHDSIIAGVPALTKIPVTYDYITTLTKTRGPLRPEITLWRGMRWTADRNLYDIASLRSDNARYSTKIFSKFQLQTGQDVHSQWANLTEHNSSAGADLKALTTLLSLNASDVSIHSDSATTNATPGTKDKE